MPRTATYTFFVSLSLAARMIAHEQCWGFDPALAPDDFICQCLDRHVEWSSELGIGAFRPMGGAL